MVLLVILWVLSAGVLAGGTWSSQVEDHLASPRFGEIEREQVRDIFIRAEHEQVPIDSLVLRLGEGVAKGVSLEALRVALESDLEAYLVTQKVIRGELGSSEADRLLGISSVWDRTVTLYRQGVSTADLAALLGMFSRQADEKRWSNYRYGGGLLLALNQWGLSEKQSLSVIEALSKSSIPGEEYRGVVGLFNEGMTNRISAEDMARRIIRFAPRSRTIQALGRMVR